MSKRHATRFIVVHCSATRPKTDIGVDEIRQMHLARGFKDIGYHFVIRRSGTIERGREEDEIGAHVEGWNAASIGICLVGGVNDDMKPEANYTPEQMNALKSLLCIMLKKYPSSELRGHRDFKGVMKACPCFDVRSWFSGVHEK